MESLTRLVQRQHEVHMSLRKTRGRTEKIILTWDSGESFRVQLRQCAPIARRLPDEVAAIFRQPEEELLRAHSRFGV